jgi:phosphopantothenoylcysteine decarboxylase/phosphopantothenate--cysteine ligase
MNPQLEGNLTPALKGKRVLLGISGSIAAFKACDIVRGLKSCGAEVRCVLTDSAQKFVTPVTLENLSGERVYTSLWGEGAELTHHIDAARWADLVLIAPATANIIAKLAHGLADDLLSTEVLAFRGPVLLAPAMNPAMYAHAAVQANLETLKSRGVALLGPARGLTSCGEEGEGRMLEPDAILESVARAFYQPSNGKHLLVTLGPTRTALDPVRYLTNRSSGRMGAAIAWAARRAGYEVTAIAGPCEALLPSDITVTRVQTSGEMLDAASQAFDAADIFVAAAAVLDWDVAAPAGQKLKKQDGAPSIDFVPNPDVLGTLAARKRPDQFVLGFAAETRDAVTEGIQKRVRKQCNALFANDVSLSSQGFESSQNAGWWIGPSEIYELPLSSKTSIAETLMGLIQASLEGRAPQGLRNLSPHSVPHPDRPPAPHPVATRPDDARVV